MERDYDIFDKYQFNQILYFVYHNFDINIQ
jgi:hypothetical protein